MSQVPTEELHNHDFVKDVARPSNLCDETRTDQTSSNPEYIEAVNVPLVAEVSDVSVIAQVDADSKVTENVTTD